MIVLEVLKVRVYSLHKVNNLILQIRSLTCTIPSEI